MFKKKKGGEEFKKINLWKDGYLFKNFLKRRRV